MEIKSKQIKFKPITIVINNTDELFQISDIMWYTEWAKYSIARLLAGKLQPYCNIYERPIDTNNEVENAKEEQTEEETS